MSRIELINCPLGHSKERFEKGNDLSANIYRHAYLMSYVHRLTVPNLGEEGATPDLIMNWVKLGNNMGHPYSPHLCAFSLQF